MTFDTYTIVLLLLNEDAPVLDEEAGAALQDAHMDHLATLHEQGFVVAAGPLSDEDRYYRGISIMNVDPERARALKETDPAVIAGKFKLKVMPWMVPSGAMHFTPTRFPHSIADLND